jgi:osmotically-inducible protein OsmY
VYQSNSIKNSDPKIIQFITQKLTSCGIRAPSRVVVSSVNGQVTLTGSVQFAHQRQAVLHATRGVDGVRRVIDSLKLIATPGRH